MFSSSMPSPPQIFQTYLLPSLPFRRRQSSTDTTSSSNSSASSPVELSASPPAETFLQGHSAHISCSRCHADLALTSQIISKGFTGRHGRAYLVSAPATSSDTANSAAGSAGVVGLPNTHTHKPVPRHLVTGLHTVCDISCAICGSVLGWKYVSAEEETQRYKVGKFILETRRVVVGSCWENDDDEQAEVISQRKDGVREDEDDEVTFDSQDEDECEDLFSGIWSPQLAVRRRRGRRLHLRG